MVAGRPSPLWRPGGFRRPHGRKPCVVETRVSPSPSWPVVALMAPRGSPSPSWPDSLRRRVPGVTVAIMAGRHHHGTQGVSVALMAGSPFPDKLRFFVESRGITVAFMAGKPFPERSPSPSWPVTLCS